MFVEVAGRGSVGDEDETERFSGREPGRSGKGDAGLQRTLAPPPIQISAVAIASRRNWVKMSISFAW